MNKQIAGGSFRKIMPSSILNEGSYAKASIPNKNGGQKLTKSAKAKLQEFFEKFGCHHCGN